MRGTEPLPEKVGRYDIEAEIGRGAMGVVYRAQDPALGRPVALKMVRLSFLVSREEQDEFERRFLSEARAVAALSHPGIITIHDVGRDATTASLYIAFELLHGRLLSEMVARGARVEWREALSIAGAIAEALHHAHERGIVHRDLKPANVMVLPSGEPKILDFGVAKVATENLTRAGQFFGTPAFMSPEQLAGETLDGRSDVFSLGAVLYTLLTGRGPFEAESAHVALARVLHHEPAPPSSLAAGIPAAVDRVVARALAKDRAGRHPDAQVLAHDMKAVLENAPRQFAGTPEDSAANEPPANMGRQIAVDRQPAQAPIWRGHHTPGGRRGVHRYVARPPSPAAQSTSSRAGGGARALSAQRRPEGVGR